MVLRLLSSRHAFLYRLEVSGRVLATHKQDIW